MAKGRCAGCGKVGSVAAIGKHVLGCEAFARSSDHASPAEEYQRWVAADRNADDRAERIRELIAGNEARLAAGVSRWATPPDILED